MSKPKTRVCVVVAGMHRSGTSALARVLNLLGCTLPKDLLGANSSNQAGHWEPIKVMELNEAMLASAGSTWDDWLPISPDWYASPTAEAFIDQATAVIESEYGDARLIALKEPRTCRLLPIWTSALQNLGIRPVFLCPIRNPVEIAASLEHRDGFDASYTHLLWARYVLDAETYTRTNQRAFFSYESLLNNWYSVMTRAGAELGIAWPRMSPKSAQEVEAFLRTELRHHAAKSDAIEGNQLISPWVRSAYQVFSQWAANGENAADIQTLDEIRANLNSASHSFGQLVFRLRERNHEAQREADAARARAEATLAHAHNERDQAVAHNAAQDSEIAALQNAVAHAKRERDEARAHADTVVAETASLREAVAQAEQQRNEARARAEVLEVEIESLRVAQENCLQDRERLRAQVEALEDAAAQALAYQSKTSIEATIAQTEVDRLKQVLAAQDAEYRTALAIIDELKAHVGLLPTDQAKKNGSEANQAAPTDAANHATAPASISMSLQDIVTESVLKLAERTEELEELRHTLESVQNAHDSLLAQSDGMIARCDGLTAHVTLLSQDLQAKSAALEDLSRLAQGLKSDLAALSTAHHALESRAKRAVEALIRFEPPLVPRKWALVRKKAEAIRAADLINESLYLQLHEDVRRSGMTAAWHYVAFGFFEDRRLEP